MYQLWIFDGYLNKQFFKHVTLGYIGFIWIHTMANTSPIWEAPTLVSGEQPGTLWTSQRSHTTKLSRSVTVSMTFHSLQFGWLWMALAWSPKPDQRRVGQSQSMPGENRWLTSVKVSGRCMKFVTLILLYSKTNMNKIGKSCAPPLFEIRF